jgi:hypothetical protein
MPKRRPTMLCTAWKKKTRTSLACAAGLAVAVAATAACPAPYSGTFSGEVAVPPGEDGFRNEIIPELGERTTARVVFSDEELAATLTLGTLVVDAPLRDTYFTPGVDAISAGNRVDGSVPLLDGPEEMGTVGCSLRVVGDVMTADFYVNLFGDDRDFAFGYYTGTLTRE